MAKKNNVNSKSIEETLWQSCDKLRGSIEPSEYKHVVLGLIFLKFASDKFERRRNELVEEGKEKYLEMKDFYNMKNVFFQRSEFDRYARFNSWGSARETFDWAEMCRVKLPIPSIKKQKAIVTIYHTLETRKKINQQLKDSIKPLCPVLMRVVVEKMVNKTKKEYAV